MKENLIKNKISFIKLVFVLCFLFASTHIARSQLNSTSYKPLKSEGVMPKVLKNHFQMRLSEHQQQIMEDLNENQYEFALRNTYYFTQLLQSGKLLYGSELNNYVENVAYELLKPQAELIDKFTFLILRVPFVNAFAIEPGIIIVTTGLLAKIENDAHLAFILSHEMIHIIKNHSIDLFVTSKKIKKEKAPQSSDGIDSKIYKYHYRSRENENEADKLGMETILSKSIFEVDIADGVFGILENGDAPLENKKGFEEFMRLESVSFPENLILQEFVKPRKSSEEVDDTLSTHPNVKARKIALNKLSENYKNEERIEYLTNENDFEKYRDLARFELIHYFMLDRNYVNAIYNAWIMLEKYPENPYLHTTIATSLYSLAKYKNNGYASDVIPNYINQDGELQPVTYLLQRLNRTEASVIALRFLWDLRIKYPEDSQVELQISDLISEFKMQNLTESDFDLNNSKSKLRSEVAYLKGYFANMERKEEFWNLYNKINAKVEDYSARNRKKKKHEGFVKGNIASYNPYFSKIEDKKSRASTLLKSNKTEEKLGAKIIKMSEKNGLNNQIFTSHYFHKNETNYYNDYSLLSDWVNEFYVLNARFDIIPYQNRFMDEFLSQNPTQYIYLTGVIEYKTKYREKVNGMYLLNLPLFVVKRFFYNDIVFHQGLLVNIENGKIEHSLIDYYNSKASETMLNNLTYKSLYKIKNLSR